MIAVAGLANSAAIGSGRSPLNEKSAQTSAELLALIGKLPDLPAKATLSDKAAREWYLNAESKTLQFVDPSAPLMKQAEQAWAYRNYLRQGVRDGMSNRSLAEQLDKDRPHLSWQDTIAKYSQKYSGDDLWKQIINAAQRSNPEVNEKLNVRPPGKGK